MANDIIDSLSALTMHEIFMTNLQGVVIAATKKELEGVKYLPAVDAIYRNNMVVDNSVEFKYDNEHHCCCVIPVDQNCKVAGAVGLIGDSNETLKFMGLVKKYTEKLITDSESLNSTYTKRQKINRIVSLISYSELDGLKQIQLNTMAMEMGINLQSNYLSVVIQLKHKGMKPCKEQIDLVREMIELEFLHPQNMITQVKDDMFFLFVKATSLDEDGEVNKCKLQGKRLYRTLCKSDWDVFIGIGSMGASIQGLRSIYYEAWGALALSKKFCGNDKVAYIGDHLMEEVLLSTNKRQCKAFLDKTVNKIKSSGEDEVLFDTIRVWCESGFKKNEASKRLNIHRNTLDYRLKRLEEVSGLSTDKYREMLELYLGILLESVSTS